MAAMPCGTVRVGTTATCRPASSAAWRAARITLPLFGIKIARSHGSAWIALTKSSVLGVIVCPARADGPGARALEDIRKSVAWRDGDRGDVAGREALMPAARFRASRLHLGHLFLKVLDRNLGDGSERERVFVRPVEILGGNVNMDFQCLVTTANLDRGAECR